MTFAITLTKVQRDKLPASDFAIPSKRLLPIHDLRHARMARSQIAGVAGLTESEREEGRAVIAARMTELEAAQQNVQVLSFRLDAMSLEVPEVLDHPNRMPFSGVLTRIDEPSDNPPHGSNGKRTLISTAVAEQALPSLLGMAIDYTKDFDGHDKRAKIGVITEATVSGNAIEIAGFLYASDFPEECARIKLEKNRLGFSYECQAAIADKNADPWVVTRCTFTGAAVLYKHLAAYTTTSLAAKAGKEIEMTPEELKAMFEAALKPVVEQVTNLAAKVDNVEKSTLDAAAMRDKVKTHADAIRACASGMEAAGIGMHETQGHVNILRHMAASMEADAVMGKLPHVYRDHDFLNRRMDAKAEKGEEPSAKEKELQASVEALSTTVKDLQAKGFNNAQQPERKTLSPEVSALLKKYDLSAAADEGKLTVQAVDKALEGLPLGQRLEQKLKLMASGVLPALKAAA